MGAADIIPASLADHRLHYRHLRHLLGSIRRFDLNCWRGSGGVTSAAPGSTSTAASYWPFTASAPVSFPGQAHFWVLDNHPVPLWAFFFGLILASAAVLLRQIEG